MAKDVKEYKVESYATFGILCHYLYALWVFLESLNLCHIYNIFLKTMSWHKFI